MPKVCLVTTDTSSLWSLGMFCSPASFKQSTDSDNDKETCALVPGALVIFSLPTSMLPGELFHRLAMYLGT